MKWFARQRLRLAALRSRLSEWRRWLARGGLLAAALGLVACMLWLGYRARVGEPSEALADDWHRSRQIVDRHGTLLRELPSDLGQRGRPLELEQLGDRLISATLASEDRAFYEHDGVDGRALLRAMAQNVRHRRIVSGASTISQQLVKLLDNDGVPPRKRTLGMKFEESARAQNLEAKLDKRAILTAYLNRLSYGRGLVGPDAAARGMFGVAPVDLSWAQAALLAVLPRAPSYLDPYKHRPRAVKRQRALIQALHQHGWLTKADRERALAEPIVLQPLSHPFAAPHLSEALRTDQLKRYATLREGRTRLSLDGPLQREVEGIVLGHRQRLADAGASNAAVLVVDNANGEVLAYVGSIDWNDNDAGGQVDMLRAPRQPGSTLKPFVYALAFEAGLSPAAALADVPMRFGEDAGIYAPENFERGFAGPISAREALAGSLNVPAVKLAAELPAGVLLQQLQRLGMRSLDKPAAHYGLSLALGSGEISALELAAAYVALARGGELQPLRFTLEDEPAHASEATATRVVTAAAAAAVSDSLSDPLARIRGLGSRGPFQFRYPVAVKTGTSSGYRDGWTAGYSKRRTVVVWVGNADGRSMRKLTGGAGAGPIFADVMGRAMADDPQPRPLWAAEVLREVEVCPLSGKPAGDACPSRITRRIPHAQLAQHHDAGSCAFHRHGRALPQANAAASTTWECSAGASASLVLLPSAYSDWLAAQPPGAPGRDAHGLPWLSAEEVSGCSASPPVARLRLDEPAAGSVLLASATPSPGEQLELRGSWRGPRALRPAQVEFVLDGEVVARSPAPYRAWVALERGDHHLQLRPADPSAAVALAETVFSVR